MGKPARVQLSSDFRDRGLQWADVAEMIGSGTVTRVRRGAYTARLADTAEDRHVQLIRATMPRLSSEAVLSHVSAALWHGLPAWTDALERVHVSRSRPYGGRRNDVVHVHTTTLGPDDWAVMDGVPVTSLIRTVLDCARTVSFPRGVALADAALMKGLALADLETGLASAPLQHGIRRARRVVGSTEPGAESVGETFSRLTLAAAGVPVPELQFLVIDSEGEVCARSDFAWRAQRTLGEFDGRAKYGRLLRAGDKPGNAVFREKVREDRLRDLGWEVVRWTWDDLSNPSALAARITAAFVRGGNRI